MEPRTALVTGSARRVGRVIAEHLVTGGWRVIVHAREEARAQETAAEIGGIAGIGADLARATAPAELGAAVREHAGGRLDLLVNNASTFVRRHPLELGLSEWHDALDVNARAPLFLTQALIADLRAARGLVVNITDRAAHEHWTAFAAHAASKAALDSLTMSLAKELAPDVRVAGICPGTVMPPDDAPADWVAHRDDLTPMPLLLDALDALIADRARSGEIVQL